MEKGGCPGVGGGGWAGIGRGNIRRIDCYHSSRCTLVQYCALGHRRCSGLQLSWQKPVNLVMVIARAFRYIRTCWRGRYKHRESIQSTMQSIDLYRDFNIYSSDPKNGHWARHRRTKMAIVREKKNSAIGRYRQGPDAIRQNTEPIPHHFTRYGRLAFLIGR